MENIQDDSDYYMENLGKLILLFTKILNLYFYLFVS